MRERLAPIAEVWLGLVWASLLGEFVAAVSFAARSDATALGWLGWLVATARAPALIAVPAVRRWAHRAPVLGAALAVAPWIEVPAVRIAALGLGFAGVSIGLLDAAIARPRPVADGWFGGVALLVAIRWWGGTFDPFAVDHVLAAVAGLATAVSGAIRPPEVRSAGSGRLLGGIAFGAATFLVHGWVLGPTVTARQAGFDPGYAGFVLVALGLGFAVTPVTRADAAWLAVVGAALL
ncbi:MAG: hypothetical protein ABMB14_33295, partial [Myxococcota bacterium]